MKSRDTFHVRKNIGVEVNRQGFIFYLCRNYDRLSPRKQAILDDCFRRVGGDNADALRQYFLTSDSAVKICLAHYIGSESTLYALARRFYSEVPVERFFK